MFAKLDRRKVVALACKYLRESNMTTFEKKCLFELLFLLNHHLLCMLKNIKVSKDYLQ